MKIGRAEALDVFRKWLADGSLVQCNLGLLVLAAAFRARVRLVLEDRIEFLSDDRTSELVLPLSADCDFGYGEPNRASGESAVAVSAVVVFLSPTGPGLDPDAVAFTELVEP